jgi:hypothetical protein
MSETSDDDGERLSLDLLYRRVYGLARDRLDAETFGSADGRARLDLVRGRALTEVLDQLGLTADSPAAEVVREAVDDANEGRPPRW